RGERDRRSLDRVIDPGAALALQVDQVQQRAGRPGLGVKADPAGYAPPAQQPARPQLPPCLAAVLALGRGERAHDGSGVSHAISKRLRDGLIPGQSTAPSQQTSRIRNLSSLVTKLATNIGTATSR